MKEKIKKQGPKTLSLLLYRRPTN